MIAVAYFTSRPRFVTPGAGAHVSATPLRRNSAASRPAFEADSGRTMDPSLPTDQVRGPKAHGMTIWVGTAAAAE